MGSLFDLSGKVAVITGSSKGIGRPIVTGQTLLVDGGRLIGVLPAE